jgi:hypothetical protein
MSDMTAAYRDDVDLRFGRLVRRERIEQIVTFDLRSSDCIRTGNRCTPGNGAAGNHEESDC